MTDGTTPQAEAAGTGPWHAAFRRLAAHKLAIAAGLYLLVQVAAAMLAPYLAPFPYDETDLLLGAAAPDSVHWLGTDDLGRDMLTRLLFGARVSLAVGLLATLVSMVIGITYGVIAGYLGGRVDELMMRGLEVLYAMPFTFFVIILMVLFGRNIYLMFIALGAIQWLNMARIVRGQVVSLKNRDFIAAARLLGVSHFKIMTRHIAPNITGPVIIYVTLTVPVVVLEEAFLSFLGLGVQEPMSSWGTLIAGGVGAMEAYPWMIIYPAVTLTLTLMALNFVGDGLREALDPQARKDS